MICLAERLAQDQKNERDSHQWAEQQELAESRLAEAQTGQALSLCHASWQLVHLVRARA